MNQTRLTKRCLLLFSVLFALLLVAGCATGAGAGTSDTTATPMQAVDYDDALPTLSAVDLADGARLQVVATTNLVADVVAQIGGDHIDLTPLMPIGADPHSFTSTPQDLITLNRADVIFINGLELEESLMPVLTSLDSAPPLVAVNVGVTTREFTGPEEGHEEGEEHHHGSTDPHTWFSVPAVEQWVTNIEAVLSTLDPTNAAAYATNAAAYRAELAALETELNETVAELPVKERKLVTDHDAFGYFAAAYDFTIIGAVIPSLSTMASPSANELAALQDQIKAEGVRAIFVGTTVNPELADQLAADTGVTVAAVYTGSLSDADGPAASYLDFMRYDMRTIVNALK